MPDNKYADNRLKLARTSLMKARQDLTVLEKLVNDEEVVDEIIGFHAQQVVEKSIKAVLT
ncbi:MAG: HEPN domain-containing protein [Candidatus Desantisbacteria bacterium]